MQTMWDRFMWGGYWSGVLYEWWEQYCISSYGCHCPVREEYACGGLGQCAAIATCKAWSPAARTPPTKSMATVGNIPAPVPNWWRLCGGARNKREYASPRLWIAVYYNSTERGWQVESLGHFHVGFVAGFAVATELNLQTVQFGLLIGPADLETPTRWARACGSHKTLLETLNRSITKYDFNSGRWCEVFAHPTYEGSLLPDWTTAAWEQSNKICG